MMPNVWHLQLSATRTCMGGVYGGRIFGAPELGQPRHEPQGDMVQAAAAGSVPFCATAKGAGVAIDLHFHAGCLVIG